MSPLRSIHERLFDTHDVSNNPALLVRGRDILKWAGDSDRFSGAHDPPRERARFIRERTDNPGVPTRAPGILRGTNGRHRD